MTYSEFLRRIIANTPVQQREPQSRDSHQRNTAEARLTDADADWLAKLRGERPIHESRRPAQPRRKPGKRKTVTEARGKGKRPVQTVELRESIGTATARVDAAKGVIRGVQVCGLTSKNGRVYPEAALRRSLPLFEGRPVYRGHREDGDTRRRPLSDLVGTIRRCRIRPGVGIVGDLHLNPVTRTGRNILEAARSKPSSLGLSGDFVAAGHTRPDGVFVLHEFREIRSVDVVDDPASTNGLLA